MTFARPILASILIIRYADLEPYKRSQPGRYIEKYMTKKMQGVRFADNLIMMLNARYRRP